MRSDVSVFILTYNEEENIVDCIQSISPHFPQKEIFILDGGSSDQTCQLAERLGVHVHKLNGTSIAQRRNYALTLRKSRFAMFVDADQRLRPNLDLDDLINRHFLNSRIAGVQFSLRAIAHTPNYWTEGFDIRHQLITSGPGPRTVIGTPCIFDLKKLHNLAYNEKISGSSDDTDFGYSIMKAGFDLRAVSDEADELVRVSFLAMLRKAFWYGQGDAEFVRFIDGRKQISHCYHVFVRELLIRPIIVLFSKNYLFFAFFLLFGVSRVIGFLIGFISKRDLSSAKS